MASKFNFEDLFNRIKEQVVILAGVSLKKYENEAKKDAFLFLENTKQKLSKWTLLLANKQLNTEDFEWLVNSQKLLLEMNALKLAGLAAIRIDQFKNGVLNTIVDTVFSFIKVCAMEIEINEIYLSSVIGRSVINSNGAHQASGPDRSDVNSRNGA